MINRITFYDGISPCGGVAYLDLVEILSNLEYTDPQIGYLLIQRLVTNQEFTQQDWILLARSIVFLPGSPITADMVESWFNGKCQLTGTELKTFLEYVSFLDSEPTYLLSDSGDFLISEN